MDVRPVFSDGFETYEFRFLWKGEAIVKDSILQRDRNRMKSRSQNAFQADLSLDDEEYSFLTFLKKVLESNEADCYESDDYLPNAIVGIYPDAFFPCLSHDWFVLREAILNNDQKAEREVKEKLKKEKLEKLPNDIFTFIICADTSNFKGSLYGISDGGISLNMMVTREELEGFARDLEMEYHVFKVKYEAGEYSDEEDEEDEEIAHGFRISYGELKKICDGEEVKDITPILKGADLALVESGYGLRVDGLHSPIIFTNLRGVEVRRGGADLARAEFSGYDLRRANLFHANLYGADLRRADLRNADLGRANLYGADLRRADLSNADLDRAHLYRADLRHADLAFADLSGSYLRNAKMGSTKLYAAYLYNTNLRGAKLRNADLRNANLCNSDLRRADLAFADLSGSDLRNADLRNANLYGADLRCACLTFLTLSRLKGANLVLAKLEGIMLDRAPEKDANLMLGPLVGFLQQRADQGILSVTRRREQVAQKIYFPGWSGQFCHTE